MPSDYTILINVADTASNLRIPVRSLSRAKKAALGIWEICDRKKVKSVHLYEGSGDLGDKELECYDK